MRSRAKVKKSEEELFKFVTRLEKEEMVRIVSGTAYGSRGEGHIRIPMVKPLKILEEAMNRIERFTAKTS